jgi:YVTN family beta-propeller protein
LCRPGWARTAWWSAATRALCYVTNRVAGSISVIDFETRAVVANWPTGGSPDMLQVSPDGTELWASGRSHGMVYVVDPSTGELLDRIRTGLAPHGLTYFPQPGRFCLATTASTANVGKRKPMATRNYT